MVDAGSNTYSAVLVAESVGGIPPDDASLPVCQSVWPQYRVHGTSPVWRAREKSFPLLCHELQTLARNQYVPPSPGFLCTV